MYRARTRSTGSVPPPINHHPLNPPMTHIPRDFAPVGAAGFVAPRHMKAIADSGNRLVAATDCATLLVPAK